MIELAFVIVFTSLAVNGLTIATGEKMLLEPVFLWLRKKIGERKIFKPIIGCVKCMPSIYGTILCILMLPITINLIWQIPLVIACSSTVATIINQQYL